jgi:hypothetical protein
MDKISFWHRTAFLANCCWLAAWAMKYGNLLPEGGLRSTVLVTGLFMAYLVNTLVNLLTGLLLLRGRFPLNLPRWLMVSNFLFLIPQLYIFFK